MALVRSKAGTSWLLSFSSVSIPRSRRLWRWSVQASISPEISSMLHQVECLHSFYIPCEWRWNGANVNPNQGVKLQVRVWIFNEYKWNRFFFQAEIVSKRLINGERMCLRGSGYILVWLCKNLSALSTAARLLCPALERAEILTGGGLVL